MVDAEDEEVILRPIAEDRRTPGGVAEDRRVAEDGEEEEMTLWPVAEAD